MQDPTSLSLYLTMGLRVPYRVDDTQGAVTSGGSWALVPTFQSSLAQGNHFVELPLYKTISFIFIQPFPTWEGLLYTSEWAVHHHLGKEIGKVTLNILLPASRVTLILKI